MDTKVTPTQPIGRSAFHEISWDLMWYLVERIDARSVCKIARLSKGLWVNLQEYIYTRAAQEGREQGGIPNMISSAIRNDASIKTLELMVKACQEAWPWIITGYDEPHVFPPLLTAVEKNRRDVIDLLLANGAEIGTKYGCHAHYELRSETPKCKARVPKNHTHTTQEANLAVASWHSYPDHGKLEWCTECGTHDDYYCNRHDHMSLCYSVLEVAIKCRHLELTEAFLKDHNVEVRLHALQNALDDQWKAGIEAIMASERIGSRLARNILNIEAFKCSVTEQFNWVECLRSIGADPRLPHPTSSKFDDILVERSLEWEEFRTVNLLLETNSLSKRYLTRLVLRCVEEDDLLDCTKTLLEKACTKSAELWIEAYSHMVYSYDNSYNFHTLWYLVEFLGELIQSGIEININRRPSYAPGMRRETEHYGETLVEYCLQKTVRCYPSCDWVRPLFHIGLDVTKLSKAGRDMYQEYLWGWVGSREKRDELLSLHRENPISGYHVLYNYRARDLYRLGILQRAEARRWAGFAF